MIPLVLCSLIVWAVIFERLWRYLSVGDGLRIFHLEAINALLRGDDAAVNRLCERYSRVPTAALLTVALERIRSNDPRLRTIGASAPFIGLFGTVVGILRSFQDMARTGSGGFAVVASGISESLIATAAGIVVAVIAVMAYNAFQTRWSSLVLLIKIQTEEMSEVLATLAQPEAGSRRGD
jgi:biopolymer transport protein ExbB/TolQ